MKIVYQYPHYEEYEICEETSFFQELKQEIGPVTFKDVCAVLLIALVGIIALEVFVYFNPEWNQPMHQEVECEQNCAAKPEKKVRAQKTLYILQHPEYLDSIGLTRSNILNVTAMAKKPIVQEWIDRFSTPGRHQNRLRAALQGCKPHKQRIKQHFRKHGQPEELFYVFVIESGCDMNARSSEGALGPAQFISETGKRYGLAPKDRTSLGKSLTAVTKYFSDLHNAFDNYGCSIMSFNTGENRVARELLEMHQTGEVVKDCWALLDSEDTFDELSQRSRDEVFNYLPQIIAAACLDNDRCKRSV